MYLPLRSIATAQCCHGHAWPCKVLPLPLHIVLPQACLPLHSAATGMCAPASAAPKIFNATDMVQNGALQGIFVEARYQFNWPPTLHNTLVDDLSRNYLPSFLTKMTNPNPSLISPSLLQWLLHPHIDWMQLFDISVKKEWHHQQTKHVSQLFGDFL